LLLVVLALCASAETTAETRHVAAPDWREQIIYFVLIDRFDDGNQDNNDQGAGEYDPTDRRRYSGGDLAGIERRLDYIQGLGATAVWITPPVAHQWWDGSVGYGGYHGYWGQDFSAVDPHFGSLEDYQRLASALHARGMYLVQDIVLNHTGNYFSYADGWDPADPRRHYRPNRKSEPTAAPTQWPFTLNDPRRQVDREAAIYHWTPPIRDFSDPRQEQSFQLAELDDLNTANPLVRRALRQSYGHWIREVGVDAFRLDTAFYVEPELLRDFLDGSDLDADDAQAPGMRAVAAATGRSDFYIFGEGFGIDRAGETTQARKIERYATEPDGRPLLPGMINFPLYGSLNEVFARGRPTAELADRIRSVMAVHRDPHRMPTFVDNHDVDRFLAAGSEAALRQALLLIMTLPGIPTIYYGTEQGFAQTRQAMFAGGFAAGGRDHFDVDAPLYRYLSQITALRRAHPVLSRGKPTLLADSAAGPGALAYRMDGAQGEQLLVVFNSAEGPQLLDNLQPGAAAPLLLRSLFALDRGTAEVRSDAAGRVSLRLPGRSGEVWQILPDSGAARVAGTTGAAAARAELADAGEVTPTAPTLAIEAQADGLLRVTGDAAGQPRLQLVLDGALGSAIDVRAADDGRYSAELDIRSLLAPSVEHRLVAWAADSGLASASVMFRVAPNWQTLGELIDPPGDDHGPSGRYRYPADPSWGVHRQMDLLGARAFAAGGSLKLELDMHRVTQSWNPANGFDHVAFSIFISLPERADGARVLPKQNARMPDGLRWQYRLRAHGWSNAMYSFEGAGKDSDGTPVSPGAAIEVDHDRNRLRFLVPAAAMGHPDSLQGTAIYVTSWDYDGGYRALSGTGDSHSFGGGDGQRDPLIMDDLLLRLDRPAAATTPTGDK
jgi:glycosidase